MKKNGFSKLVSQMPLRSIEAVEDGESALAEVAITGICGGNWLGVGNTPGAIGHTRRTYKLRGAQGIEARRLIDFVRSRLTPPSP